VALRPDWTAKVNPDRSCFKVLAGSLRVLKWTWLLLSAAGSVFAEIDPLAT
jgi:hypothetical protein